MALVLKGLGRQCHGFKFHSTDWEKPGIEPAIPGLQDLGLSPTPWRLLNFWQGVYFLESLLNSNKKVVQ